MQELMQQRQQAWRQLVSEMQQDMKNQTIRSRTLKNC